MTNLVEKDSPLVPLSFLAVVFLLFLGGGLALAYTAGVFTGKNEVAANDRRTTEEARHHSSPVAAPAIAKP